MEIILQGKSIYGIPDWDGKVDVEGLKLFQIKRIAGSKTSASLFKKLLKVLKGEHSPIKLPKDLDPENLDMGDFTQVIIGITAMSKGRSVRKIYECPHCHKEQPRVIDIMKVFMPKKPEVEGGMVEVDITPDPGKGDPKHIVTCKHLRVKDYVKINDMIDRVKDSAIKTVQGKQVLDLTTVKEAYGSFYDFQDQEDIIDFCEALQDIGLIALRIDNPQIKDDEYKFLNTLKWLFMMQGEQMEVYAKISEAVMGLSADMDNEYESVCTEKKCGKKFVAVLEPTDYFFGLQFPSSQT